MSDVVNLSTNPKVPNIFGPKVSGHSVIVDGRKIPRLRVHDCGDSIEFILDDRWSYTFPREWSYLAASFVAEAMAVAEGYTHMGADRPGGPFAPQVAELGSIRR